MESFEHFGLKRSNDDLGMTFILWPLTNVSDILTVLNYQACSNGSGERFRTIHKGAALVLPNQ